MPWDYDFTTEEFDGLFLSNGPGRGNSGPGKGETGTESNQRKWGLGSGNPEQCVATIKHLRAVMATRPTLPWPRVWGCSHIHQRTTEDREESTIEQMPCFWTKKHLQ